MASMVQVNASCLESETLPSLPFPSQPQSLVLSQVAKQRLPPAFTAGLETLVGVTLDILSQGTQPQDDGNIYALGDSNQVCLLLLYLFCRCLSADAFH